MSCCMAVISGMRCNAGENRTAGILNVRLECLQLHAGPDACKAAVQVSAETIDALLPQVLDVTLDFLPPQLAGLHSLTLIFEVYFHETDYQVSSTTCECDKH